MKSAPVTPAQAGAQEWIPAFAGMTGLYEPSSDT
jgi:hypothetical protein